jgi:hypothetical protein
MKRLYTFTTACALGMALSGCVQSPTAANSDGHTFGSGNATEARFSLGEAAGGGTFGSGHRGTTGEAPSDTSSAATVNSTGGQTTVDSAAVTERGGYTIGSGN